MLVQEDLMHWKLYEMIGKGNFGLVFRCVHKTQGNQCAAKLLRGTFSWEQAVTLREAQMLYVLGQHPNIVKLYEIIMMESRVFLIFELLEHKCLMNFIGERQAQRQPATIPQVQSIVGQVLSGLQHMHEHGVIHRDIKPENILRNGNVWKVADASLACRYGNDKVGMTDYVSTRWYRSPEILVRSTKYDSKVDVFAVGCVMVELLSLDPFYPGTSDVDQLLGVAKLLGVTVAQQNTGAFIAEEPRGQGRAVDWEKIVPGTNSSVHSLLQNMMMWNARQRWSCAQVLRHPFFASPKAATTNPGSCYNKDMSRPVTGYDDLPSCRPGPAQISPTPDLSRGF